MLPNRPIATLIGVVTFHLFFICLGCDFVDAWHTIVTKEEESELCIPLLQFLERSLARMSNHIDLYDNEKYVNPAVAKIVDWFNRYLMQK